MGDFLGTCVQTYCDLTGCKASLLAFTPFLEDVDPAERVVDSTATLSSDGPAVSSRGATAELASVASRVLMKVL